METGKELQGLAAPPILDTVNERRLALLRNTVAKRASDAELASFLELASKYELDPFTGEIWLAKSQGKDGAAGRLLLMVGRDGLRKIAQRNGLIVDGDVVRESDSFRVERLPDGSRGVSHSYEGDASKRGQIVGAWCEVRPRAVLGPPDTTPAGFFFAPLHEYKPQSESKLKYSPWGAQESVMILAAAERQALRQATPLSGLLVEGEAERNAELLEAAPEEALSLPPEVEDVLGRAAAAGHEGLADRASAEIALADQPPERVEVWLRAAEAELLPLERQRAQEAAQRPQEPSEEPSHAEPPEPELSPQMSDIPVDMACGAADPHREGVFCEQPMGHEGPHMAAGETWDSFAAPEPALETLPQGAGPIATESQKEWRGHFGKKAEADAAKGTLEEHGFTVELTGSRGDWTVVGTRPSLDDSPDAGEVTSGVKGRAAESAPAGAAPEENDRKARAEALNDQARAKVAEANAANNEGDEARAEELWDQAEKFVAEADAILAGQQGELGV